MRFVLTSSPALTVGSRSSLLACLASCLVIASCGSASDPEAAPDRLGLGEGEQVTIEWFVGLGTGAREGQIEAQEAVVEAFNQSHPGIRLEVELVPNEVAFDVLQDRVMVGDVPDIIGPVGIRGSNAFASEFVDLEPFIAETGFDLSVYDDKQIEVWRNEDGELTAIPFGVFPAMLFVNTDLFEEAGVPTPPQSFGELYEGEPWDMDALAQLATTMTRDASGNSADDPRFDPNQTVQFGFDVQWMDDPRALGTFFGAGSMTAVDGSAQIPEPWVDSWNWYHDLMWEAHAAPTAEEVNSELLDQRNAFNSGNVAMALSHLWYTSSLVDDDGNPQIFADLAVVPTHNGQATSNLHADTFRIMSGTEHPDEAFEVLTYLLESETLLSTYRSFPARIDLQEPFLAALDALFPQGVEWSVVGESLAHPDVPSHEAAVPNFLEVEDRLAEFKADLTNDPALDMSATLDELIRDLDVIFAGS